MRTVKMAVLALVASWAIGCISIDSVIKVKPDGSGTMEQTMLINSSSMSMMSMMGGGENKDAKPNLDPATIFSKEKLAAEAANLGEGVTFVSSEPAAQGEMKGVKAVYAFTDFNKLRVSTALPDMEDGGTKVSGKGEALPIRFTRSGGSSMLTMNLLEELAKADAKAAAKGEGKADDKTEKPEMPKEMMAMLAPMFKDMRVAIAVEPVGTLVRTNATHVQGKRVTLFDVAFGELFADPAGLEKMEKLGSNPSLTEVKAALKGMKGIKINDVDKLEIEFK